MNNPIKAALGVIGDNDGRSVVSPHLVTHQNLVQDNFRGPGMLLATVVFSGYNSTAGTIPHGILANLFVVHVEIWLQHDHSPEFLQVVVANLLQKYCIKAVCPAVKDHASNKADVPLRGLDGSNAQDLGISFEQSKVETRQTTRGPLLGSGP